MADREAGPGISAVLAERVDASARSRLVARELEGIPVLEARLPGRLRALFTTRLGGHSEGRFRSLNLDPRTGDDPAVVSRNRRWVADAVGRRLVSPAQVHGTRVAGTAEYSGERDGSPCDGLTVHQDIDRGLAALLLFADCLPVVLCGEVDLAVAHGGWRGILAGVIQQAGRSMMGAPGMAVIGPSIGPCCFTVGEEVAAAFAARFGDQVVRWGPEAGERGEASPRVDLWEAASLACAEVNIRAEHVVNPRICTVCNADLFFSFRKEGPVTGRHGCVAWAIS